MKTTLFLLIGLAVVLQQNATYGHTKSRILTEFTTQSLMSHEESDEEEFVVESAQGALLEVKLGELAQTNGSAQVVKDFGKMMTKDHSKGYDELKALALQKKITIPARLSKKGQRKYDKLAKKTGHEFDKEYMDYMVEDHDSDIEAFEETVDESKDADIKAWAAKALPMLKQHLEMAKSGYAAVK
jgi:putative membrane protein